jgi:sec-independent protein translocase protein TatA
MLLRPCRLTEVIMGLSGIGGWQLIILLLVAALLFGGKRLRNLGGDLGGAIRGFRKSMDGDEAAAGEFGARAREHTQPEPARTGPAEQS